jgi:hypothetical protein
MSARFAASSFFPILATTRRPRVGGIAPTRFEPGARDARAATTTGRAATVALCRAEILRTVNNPPRPSSGVILAADATEDDSAVIARRRLREF